MSSHCAAQRPHRRAPSPDRDQHKREASFVVREALNASSCERAVRQAAALAPQTMEAQKYGSAQAVAEPRTEKWFCHVCLSAAPALCAPFAALPPHQRCRRARERVRVMASPARFRQRFFLFCCGSPSQHQQHPRRLRKDARQRRRLPVFFLPHDIIEISDIAYAAAYIAWRMPRHESL